MADSDRPTPARSEAIAMVNAERDHQDDKYGWMDSTSERSCLPKGDEGNDTKLTVVTEELGEVARELNDARDADRELDRAHLHHELAQVAACCVAWIEADIERRIAEAPT